MKTPVLETRRKVMTTVANAVAIALLRDWGFR